MIKILPSGTSGVKYCIEYSNISLKHKRCDLTIRWNTSSVYESIPSEFDVIWKQIVYFLQNNGF